MAFSPNFTACLKDCCSSLIITDISGLRAGATKVLPNPTSGAFDTGWDSSDTDAIDPLLVEAATLYITYPGTTTAVEAIVAATFLAAVQAIDVTIPSYPTYTVSPTSSTFPDGQYIITMTIVHGGTTYTKSITTLFYCGVQCCVNTMWAALPAKACGCDYDEWLDKCLKAEGLLIALRASAGCGNTAAITSILETLTEICDYVDCGCS